MRSSRSKLIKIETRNSAASHSHQKTELISASLHVSNSLKFKITTLALAITSTLCMSPAALAQDEELEEIQITGTRVRVTDGMATPTPVTSLTPVDLLNFEPGGTISEQLDALPQFFSTGT